MIFTSTLHGITLVDPSAGKINWELDQKFVDRCVSSPLLAADLVIAGYGAGLRGTRYVAVRLAPLAKGQQPAVAYELTHTVPLVPTPLASNGRLFLWTDDGIVSCLRLANGEVIWQKRVGGAYYSSPVCVDNRLYCIAKNGEVVVLAAADKFELLARVPLGEAELCHGGGGRRGRCICGPARTCFRWVGQGGGDSVRCLKEPAVLTPDRSPDKRERGVLNQLLLQRRPAPIQRVHLAGPAEHGSPIGGRNRLAAGPFRLEYA